MKHTPGPWTVVEAVSYGVSFLHVRGPLGENVAMTGVTQERIDKQQRCNAQLISASPELLECLKNALAELDKVWIGLENPSGGKCWGLSKTRSQILSAIDKAEAE